MRSEVRHRFPNASVFCDTNVEFSWTENGRFVLIQDLHDNSGRGSGHGSGERHLVCYYHQQRKDGTTLEVQFLGSGRKAGMMKEIQSNSQ